MSKKPQGVLDKLFQLGMNTNTSAARAIPSPPPPSLDDIERSQHIQADFSASTSAAVVVKAPATSVVQSDAVIAAEQIEAIAVEQLERLSIVQRLSVDPHECRLWVMADRPLDEADHASHIARSFKSIGQLQPVVVRPINDATTPNVSFEIIAGQVRWRAAIAAGVKLDVLARPMNDREAYEVMCAENEQRRDLSDYSKAMRMKRALAAGIYSSQLEMAKAQNPPLKQATISRILVFTELPMHIIKAIPDIRMISFNRGYEIVRAISHGFEDQILQSAHRLAELPTDLVSYFKDLPPDAIAVRKSDASAVVNPDESANRTTTKRRHAIKAIKYMSDDGKYLFSMRPARSGAELAVIAIASTYSSIATSENFVEAFRKLLQEHLPRETST